MLDLLICPISKERLKPATSEEIQALNSRIDKRNVYNKSGELLTNRLVQGFMNDSGTFMYPVISGIPLLLPDAAIDYK